MKTPAWKRVYDFLCKHTNIEKITVENKNIIENYIKGLDISRIIAEVGISRRYLRYMLDSIFNPTPMQKNILLNIYRRLPENGDGIIPTSYINSRYNSISDYITLNFLQIFGVIEYHKGYIKTNREILRKFYPSIEKWIEKYSIQKGKDRIRKRVPQGRRIRQAIEIIGKPIEEITEDDIDNLSRIDWMIKLKETGDESWFIPLRGVGSIKSNLKKLIKNKRINRIYGERRSITIG